MDEPNRGQKSVIFKGKVKSWAARLKSNILVLNLAYKDKRTPWYAKVLAAIVVGYALSPIDLIPDFIPVLGYLDDLLLVPLGIYLVIKLIPPEVMQDARLKAQEMIVDKKPTNWIAAAVIITIWVGLLLVVILWSFRLFKK